MGKGTRTAVFRDVSRSGHFSVPRMPKFSQLLSAPLQRAVASVLPRSATPTVVQEFCIPPILSGRDVIIGGATGSGKTIGFLAPLIQRQQAAESMDPESIGQPYQPRCLILCPSRELALQTHDVARRLAHHARFRSVALVGGGGKVDQAKALRRGVEVAIATPGRLFWHLNRGNMSLEGVRAVVVDEADTMLLDFGDPITAKTRDVVPRRPTSNYGTDVVKTLDEDHSAMAVLEALSSRDNDAATAWGLRDSKKTAIKLRGGFSQVILVGASFPKGSGIGAKLRNVVPGAAVIAVPGLHKPPATLAHNFVRSRGDKHSALVESLNMHGRAMVFCNGVPSCRSTEHVLREAGFDSVGLHGGIPPKLRSKFYQSFLDGSASVLVCTDIAARGLDFGGEVDTVVNFDTPLDATTYLHRAGRAGRAGARGIVTTLYAKREAARANELRTAVQSGSELVSIDHTLHRAGDVLKNTLKRSSSPKHTKMKLANDPAVPKHVAKVVHRTMSRRRSKSKIRRRR